MSVDVVDVAEAEPEFVVEIVANAETLDYFQKSAEFVTAATSEPALKQQSCLGSSAVAEIEVKKQNAVSKDLNSSYPEQPQLDTYLVAYSTWRDQIWVASKD